MVKNEKTRDKMNNGIETIECKGKKNELMQSKIKLFVPKQHYNYLTGHYDKQYSSYGGGECMDNFLIPKNIIK